MAENLLLKCENGEKHDVKIENRPWSRAPNHLTGDAKFGFLTRLVDLKVNICALKVSIMGHAIAFYTSTEFLISDTVPKVLGF